MSRRKKKDGAAEGAESLVLAEAPATGQEPPAETPAPEEPPGASAETVASKTEPTEALPSIEGTEAAIALFADLQAAAVDEGLTAEPIPFAALNGRDRRVWNRFADLVERRLSATANAAPAGMVRCRARTTVALRDAIDRHGRPVREVREGDVCLVPAATFERTKKHLESL